LILGGGGGIHFKNSLSDISLESFDYIAAFEVLEHIENDKEILLEWKRYLKDGGRLILTVPAHMKLFIHFDIYGGHYRRYDKLKLISLLNNTGFEVENTICYGFPLNNLIRFLFHKILWRNRGKSFKGTIEERTTVSSYSREKEYKLRVSVKMFQGITILFSFIQRLFYKTDLGIGYVLMARKVSTQELLSGY
jgi:SAM-dependent methyltransferase